MCIRDSFFQHFGWGFEPVNLPALNTALSLTASSPPALPPHGPQSDLLTISQRVRAEPGSQTHFGAFQFKISTFGIVTYSLFAAEAQTIILFLEGTKLLAPKSARTLGRRVFLSLMYSYSSSTILLAVAVPN